MIGQGTKKVIFVLIITVAVLTVTVWGKCLHLQRIHYMAGEKSFLSQDWKVAIREFDLAIHMYTPGSSYLEKSAKRLWEIGEMFESDAKLDWALISFRSLRGALLASQSLSQPKRGWIEKCNKKIASLNVRTMLKNGILSTDEAPEMQETFFQSLNTTIAPDTLWAIIAELAFLSWIISVFWIIFKGIGKDISINIKPLTYGIVALSVSFTVWIFALLKA